MRLKSHLLIDQQQFTTVLLNLKVYKHEILFLNFFAETETLWSQGPVT
jgi:hypothetical protein